jgi:glycosyltransferase involved in cell wall biosynthesis
MYDVAFYVPWIGPLLRPGQAPPTGGAETQIYLLTRALSRRGARVCVIAFETPDGLPSQVDGVDVIARTPYEGRRPWVGKVTEVAATWGALGRVRARVVVTRAAGPYVPLVAAFARATRRRFVYSSASDGDFTSDLVERYRALYHLGVRAADTLVVQTDRQMTLARRFGRPAVVIRSITEPAPITTSSPVAFLWIGRLVDYKQPLEYVELARRLPGAQFRMVGVPVGDSEESRRLLARLHEESRGLANFTLLAPRPRPQLAALLDEAVAVVNTSADGLEGMPNTFLEGWVRGVPALALSHDPDGIIERHALGGVAAGSPDRLAALAAELWRTRGDRADLSRRCRRYTDVHHSPDAVARQWMAVLGIPERAG